MNKVIKNTESFVDDIMSSLSEEAATPPEVTKPTPVNEKAVNTDVDKIETLPITSLETFKSHPFKIRDNEDFNKLVDSIKENGVLIPAIARPKGEGYELIAGHRRKAVCEKLGIETMPVIVKNMTDEQSVIFMVDSNVQRENILPSEKAFAYKMKIDAIKKQGKRENTASVPLEQKSAGITSRDVIAKENGESPAQVQRYIRLTELNPQLLKMLDEGKIGFRPAVELSYLSKTQQKHLLSVMDAEQATPSLSQAILLKKESDGKALNEDSITTIMQVQKPNQKECIRIPYERLKPHLQKDMTPADTVEFVIKVVTDYHQRQLQKQRSRDAR